MPQLNPSSWFMIFLFSWIIFLLFLPLKLSNHTLSNDPVTLFYKEKNQPWPWPWF